MTAQPDWLALCRRIAGRVEAGLAALPAGAGRERVVGAGDGGDQTTAIDKLAEDVVVVELEALGLDCTLISEELGSRSFGAGGRWRIVVDPIDGSLNAKRGLPFFCLSIAIADGPRLGDVQTAFVRDLVAGEEWTAERGLGARLNGRPLRLSGDREGLGIVVLEATGGPAGVARAALALEGHVERIRILGALALALCQIADDRADAVVALSRTRSVDIAAAALILSEAGAHLAAPDIEGGAAMMALDAERRSRVVACRDAATAARLLGLLR